MSTSSRRRWWLTGLLALAFTAPAGTAPLDGLANLLPKLQPERRAELQRRAGEWAGWNAAQRESFQQQLAAWDALPRTERAATRERYLAWQALPVTERARVLAAADRFRALPAAQQQELRAAFDALDGSARRGWLLGPVLGGDYPALQPLLAQVPVEEHAPLMRALRAMTPPQRRDLAVLMQRTPPQERAQLRSELAGLETEHVSAWLWDRLDR